MVTEQQVRQSLTTVMDPCSIFNGTNMSMIDLGMVDEVTIDDTNNVHVMLFLDDPLCVYMYEITRHIREAIETIEGAGEVTIEVKGDAIWTEDLMTPEARERIQERRRRLMQARGQQPMRQEQALPIASAR